MTSGSRLPALVLAGVVVAAAAMLIAGLGIWVGIGLLVGAALGTVTVVAVVALAQRGRCPGPSIRSRESEYAALVHHGREMMRVAGVEAGALRRVLAVGRQVEASGVRVELVAVELRADGGLATLAAHTRPPLGPPGHMATARVSDDIGTEYVAAAQAVGGSTPSTVRYEIRFAPAANASARHLTLAIDDFADPFPGPGEALAGPWSFDIDLRDAGTVSLDP